MNKLIMTVGLPRIGKSTFVKTLGFPIVNPDSIRLAFHGQPFIAQTEEWIWLFAKLMVKSLFQAGHENVILDSTNITRKFRDSWKSDKWKREFYIFPVATDICIKRATKDNRLDLIDVIVDMAKRYEPVSPEEGTIIGML